ncbi:MAG: hypothetical protein HKO93_01990 [Flavobacteriales bacterium]|nr:hypothetical protein [Flavobacteriales bacterium]
MKLIFTSFISIALLISCSNQESEKLTLEGVDPEDLVIEISERVSVTDSHIRGLHLIDETSGWASGSKGTFLRMTDGNTWVEHSIQGYTRLDFRDIHGFDSLNAVIMASGSEGKILRTKNGGRSWQEVYSDISEGVFLDGMDFNDSLGICYGDPINGRFYGVYTLDQGRTWTKSSMKGFPEPLSAEAGYAASGTGIVVMDDREYTATGGGSSARVIRSMRELEMDFRTEALDTPIKSEEGCGIFSIAFKNNSQGVAVGGCYLDSTSTDGNCAVTFNAGNDWLLVDSLPPSGYRSCVAYSDVDDFYLTCGRTGIDVSVDDGLTWKSISTEGYFTCSIAESSAWLMGRSGKMAKANW